MIFPFRLRQKPNHIKYVSKDMDGKYIVAVNKVSDTEKKFGWFYISKVINENENRILVAISHHEATNVPIFSSKIYFTDFRKYLKNKQYQTFSIEFDCQNKNGEKTREVIMFFYNPQTKVFGRAISFSPQLNAKKRCRNIEIAVPYKNIRESNAKISTYGTVYDLAKADMFEYTVFDDIEKRRLTDGPKIDYFMCGYLRNPYNPNETLDQQRELLNKLPENFKNLF